MIAPELRHRLSRPAFVLVLAIGAVSVVAEALAFAALLTSADGRATATSAVIPLYAAVAIWLVSAADAVARRRRRRSRPGYPAE
jgi:membrane protein implicated in regulation of membrane protease activity